MYTRKDAEEIANRTPVNEEQKRAAQKLGEAMRGGNRTQEQTVGTFQSSESDSGTNSAYRQNQSQQSNEQLPQSPTDDASGKAAKQEQSATIESPSPTPKPTQSPRGPSWER